MSKLTDKQMRTLTRGREDWLRLVQENPKAFGNSNGFNDLTEIHNDWLKEIVFGTRDYTLQAHRGSYKSTTLAIGIALIMVLFPNRNIILVRKTEPDVKQTVNSIKKLLQSGIYRDLCRVLYGVELELTTSTAFALDTNLNTSTSGDTQLLALGVKTSMVGKHAHYVFTDDIVNLEDRISKPEREIIKIIYEDMANNIKNRGGRIFNTGTPWHKDDAFAVMPPAVRHDCYTTGLISEEELEAIRSRMDRSRFAANYELKHVATGDALFKDPVIDDGSHTHMIYDGICHIDAAYGGSDSTAFTIVKEDLDTGKVYVYGLLRPMHVDNLIPLFESRRQLYRAGTVYTEANADKGYLSMRLNSPKAVYHERQNKHIKISTHLKGRWEDIIFIDGTDEEYIEQILDYNEHASHDDAPDSLASALRILAQRGKRVDYKDTINRLKSLGL